LNYLLRYFREQENIILQQLVLIRQLPGKKPVHDLRVAYKKWRTVLRFAEEECKPNCHPEIATVRTIFRIAGIYRDEEMSDVLLKKYSKKEKCLLPSFQQYLRALKSIGRVQTKAAALTDIHSCLLSIQHNHLPVLADYTDAGLNDLIQTYTSRKWKECLSMQEHFNKKAHAIRKELKQVYYLLLLCQVNTLFDDGQMKQLDQILNALGNWHDHEVLHQRLRYFRKNMLVKEMEEYGQAIKLEALLKLEREGWLLKADEGLKEM